MKTLLFFGAGSTFKLGLPITKIQEEFFKTIVGERRIRDRLLHFAKENIPALANDEDFLSDIERTLKLLYDSDEMLTEAGAYEKRKEAEREFIGLLKGKIAKPEVIEQYLRVYVYPWYDWLAFKSITKALIEQGEEVSVQDILSVMTKAAIERISLPTKEIFVKEDHRKLPIYVNYPERMWGALRVYKLLLFKLFKHTLRVNLNDILKLERSYKNFCVQSVRLFMDIPWGEKDLTLEKVVGNLCMATTNWDPVFPILYMKSCKEINDEIFLKGERIYLSYGAPIIVRKMNGNDKGWYVFEEDSAAMVNLMTFDKGKCRLAMQIFKFFVPHGLMNMRVCPRCQNVFIVLPDDVGELTCEKIVDIFLLDPLPSKRDIEKLSNANKYKHFNLKMKNFLPSKIECPICDTPTFFNDTFMQIQSVLKPDDPPVVRKAYVDYCVHFSKANHLVFIGYSFPIDDIPHLLSLLTMSINPESSEKTDRRFSVVLYNRKLAGKGWFSIDKALKSLSPSVKEDRRDIETIKNIQKLTKKENVRLNFSGFPDILNEFRIKEILNWKKPD